MERKLNLGEITVQSFTTTVKRPQDIKGGATQLTCNVGCAYNSEHPEICNTDGCTNNFWCDTGAPWWCNYQTDPE